MVLSLYGNERQYVTAAKNIKKKLNLISFFLFNLE